MTALHAYFALRDQQSFQKLLESSRTGATSSSSSTAPALSSSGGHSWTKHSVLSNAVPQCDVNARDWLGRTVLHLASADMDCSLEYVRMLLAHPRIDINVADVESRWTALHRAMYAGNLAACVLLLQRPDIDTSLKDLEGYTAFDLYNATVEGTKPTPSDPLELYTWGTNRNAALGTDADDRARPERVPISYTVAAAPASETLSTRFRAIPIRSVEMSKLQTVAITDESCANLRACGFSTGLSWGGATGTGMGASAAQMKFSPIRDLSVVSNSSETQIVQIALGQDHILALTRSGTVLSWGSNRYAQLGYVIESGSVSSGGVGSGMKGVNAGSTSSSSQAVTTPRRIFGLLKKEFVIGVAASRRASACWTTEALYTWGTNGGQLGYGYDVVTTSSGPTSSVTVPTQVVPRRVAQVTSCAQEVALGDTAMAVLLASKEVICFTSGRSFKINFPAASFPPALTAYRPPAAQSNMDIAKVVCADNSFAALSSNGELFTFSFPAAVNVSPAISSATDSAQNAKAGSGTVLHANVIPPVKPQRVWSLRKQFSAVRDVDLGVDGTLVLCTESGHVFVRSGSVIPSTAFGTGALFGSKTKQGKFQRVQHLQRVVRVAAGAGALAALRADCTLPRIETGANGTLANDLAAMQPFLFPPTEIPEWYRRQELKAKETSLTAIDPIGVQHSNAMADPDADVEDDDTSEQAIGRDAQCAQKLISLIERDAQCKREGRGLYDLCGKLPDGACALAHGANLFVQVDGGFRFPVHSVVLAARSEVIADILSGKAEEKSKDGVTVSFQLPSAQSLGCLHAPFLHFTSIHPLTALILATYLYTDDLPALWDRRVCTNMTDFGYKDKSNGKGQELGAVCNPAQIRNELQTLARMLELSALAAVVNIPVKRPASPTMTRDFHKLFERAQPIDGIECRESTNIDVDATKMSLGDPLAPNTILELRDRAVYAHSVVLRARSSFFASLFEDPVWTQARWQPVDGTLCVTVQLRHMRWQVVDFVMRYMYSGTEEEMFEVLEFIDSVDDVLDFVYEVISVASELLIDRLLLICSNVVLKFVNLRNACTLLERASDFYLTDLVSRLHAYIARNMEAMLNTHSLDALEPSLVRALSLFVRVKQVEKHPVTRSGKLAKNALDIYADWLAMEDFPRPIAPSKKTTTALMMKASRSNVASDVPPSSSALAGTGHASETAAGDDELFVMDPIARDESMPSLGLHALSHKSMSPSANAKAPPAVSGSQPDPLNTYGPWKTRAAQTPSTRVDLRAIMAETEAAAHPTAIPVPLKITRNGSRESGSGSQTSKTPPHVTTEPNTLRTEMPWRLLPSAARPVQRANQSLKDSPSRIPSARASSESLRPSPPVMATIPTESRRSEVKVPAPSTPSKAHGMQATQSNLGKGKVLFGPTFTPMRQSTESAGISTSRRVSEGNAKAWITSSLTYVPDPVDAKRTAGVGEHSNPVPSPKTQGFETPLSFAEIQEQQQRATSSVRTVAKNLREIQEEERAQTERERARRDEETFLKWWADEEERVRIETRAELSVPAPSRGGRKQGSERRKAGAKGKVDGKGTSVEGTIGALETHGARSGGSEAKPAKGGGQNESAPSGRRGTSAQMTRSLISSRKAPRSNRQKPDVEGGKHVARSQHDLQTSSLEERRTES